MTTYEEHFSKALNFIQTYKSLVDCHLVDFITQNLWESCLPDSLRLELEIHGPDNKFGTKIDTKGDSKLNEFFKSTKLLSLDGCPFIYELKDLSRFLSSNAYNRQAENQLKQTKLNFMKNKKCHEVDVMAKLVSKLSHSDSDIVIDAGAGKGYLSMHLSENFGIQVLAIDSSSVNHKGAIRRQEIIKKKTQRNISVHYTVEHINDKTNFESLVKMHYPSYDPPGNLILTGLHTCGSLAHSTIKAFLASDSIKKLCIVSCCYHLTKESLTEECNFTKNARMLAQQSVERLSKKDKPLSSSLFYRAILQVLLESMGLRDVKIGRGAPADNFEQYARWVIETCEKREIKIPSVEALREIYEEHANLEWKIEVFQMLRVHLGSVVEAALLLDRIMYLERSKRCSKVGLFRLFDPVLSPRCYAIIAIK
ncbi:methyltransferase-like protein 25 [Cephus cinctus]|uniref:Methyltransferase-like protein 25 n=1 Tax=Cephus cinctus TaxID=211228 RepID=A0AAJ7BR03_CEPCN|nr:methyltransferase-like protein 25 [Cephus cinctus]XP_015592135.1 methyltransferase-like protein 25 [Cephus cinctus]